MNWQDKAHLRIPGPTPIPLRIQQAMAQPMIGHRGQATSQLLQECATSLRALFGTMSTPLILTGSGTSALEAAVINTVQPGEEAIVVVTGAFGDRFAKIVKRYGITLHRLDIPWGESCSPEQLTSFVQAHPRAKAVFLTYCETSTAVLNPINELARVVREHSDALVVVDGVSCLGAVPCLMDEWHVDIMVTGSQKALMLPPGLAMVAVSDRAWAVIEQQTQPPFYLDLLAYKKSMEQASTPYTPAVSLLYGLKEALLMLEEEGWENVFARHQRLKRMTRTGIRALGLPLFTNDQDASPTVTAIDGRQVAWETEALRKHMSQMKVTIAGGQQHLKGQIARIGHMGFCDELDILTVLSVLEMALVKLGVSIELGSSVKAAQEVMLDV
ncbi:pyridoxal-phosphate-dependent aminotransferase family protein [Laceyella putida]|uniref:Pyridoxal-phosphate-dependent aminotransferase family protein n=1 Tax=Laceyella putida TaxID=110101 RepID=A0ABW2RMV1_9BACL